MKRRGFIGAVLATCAGASLPRKAVARNPEAKPAGELMRVVGVSGDTVHVERGASVGPQQYEAMAKAFRDAGDEYFFLGTGPLAEASP